VNTLTGDTFTRSNFRINSNLKLGM